MKVLVIDDIEDTVKEILDSCDERGWEKQLSGFDQAYSSIIEFDPDVIVLDWLADAENTDLGETILNKIWDITFRPVVLFTANAAIIDISSKLARSNMLKIIPKGDESPVIEFLIQMEKFASELSSYRSKMSFALIEALNSITYLNSENDVESSAVGYVLSKRTSAFFDDQFISEISPSWVQYLCPPLSSCLNVCDIIRIINAETDVNSAGNPEEYLLVLTPSCDMFYNEDRSAKVSHALCARCYPKTLFHGKELADNPSSSNIKSVKKRLNQGYSENYVPLPGFSNLIPYMTADLKKVELISLDRIAGNSALISEDSTHYRVASICSPFREQIVWAHLQNSCRPGVPDRNTELWAKEMLTK